MRIRVGILAAFFCTSVGASAWAGALGLAMPGRESVVLGTRLTLDVRDCTGHKGNPELKLLLDGAERSAEWQRGPYKGQWLAQVELAAVAESTARVTHQLDVWARCGGITNPLSRASARFFQQTNGARTLGERVSARFAAKNPARKLKWDWGPAVFLYGLEKLSPGSSYLHDYHEHWVHEGIPRPNRSDSCPPALTALELARAHGDWVGITSAQTVAEYVRTERRNKLGALNHLGHWWLGKFFPSSIWVDSLMMYAVFATQWGTFLNEPDLRDFGARQPLIFASVLQDAKTGLFRHAWRVKAKKPIPKSETFWLRGNGWVLVSIAEILDELPPNDERRAELIAIFRKLADGLLPFQLENGLWDSVANGPGYSYPETSGSLLVSYALAHGVHQGWLEASYLAVAKRAFAGATALLTGESADGPLSLPYISGPTNPGPRILYKSVLPKSDLHYGVGAYLMAAAELAEEKF